MLHEFLADSRDKIIDRTRAKVASRSMPRVTEAELEHGIPLFLTQLVAVLQTPPEAGGAGLLRSGSTEIGTSAAKHGDDLLRMGFSVGQVVSNYGGLCQAITEIAVEDNVSISTGEFKTLNGCLDDAIASAVSEFERQREQSVSNEGVKHLGLLAHELRNALNTASLAFAAIQKGTVGASGSTGAILKRSLDHMRELIDRSLAEVRLKAGSQKCTQVSVVALAQELAITAEVEAQHRGLQFTVEFPADPVAAGVTIDADPHLLISALTNLLQNAFKFTRPNSHVSLRIFVTADRVRIEIEDECGGLPTGKVEDLFRLFEQQGTDRSGLGFGLAISRRAVEANAGTIDVRDLPGQGCVFSVDLPRHK